MTGLYLTWLADEMRAAGLVVHEWPGWQTRARRSGGYADPKGPLCVMWHHTASETKPENDVRYMADNAVTKPIANVMPDRNGEVWLMAAGATNTNGPGRTCTFSRGVVPADGMNSRAFGMEISNDGGGGEYPAVQIEAAFIISNLVNRMCGNRPEDVMTHAIYAPIRKPDPAKAIAVQGRWQPHGYGRPNTWVLDDLIAECAHRANNTPPPQPQPPQPRPPAGDDFDMASTQLLLHDVRGDVPGVSSGPWYKVGPTSMVWVQDGDALNQMLMRVAESEDGTKVSPYDGLVWKQFSHGGDDVISSYGPISGTLPPDRDRWGRVV